jgi:hypothetical protein
LLESFLWGAGGSAAVEILLAYRVYLNDSPTPARYSKWGFWVSRVLVAIIAGGLVRAGETPALPVKSSCRQDLSCEQLLLGAPASRRL